MVSSIPALARVAALFGAPIPRWLPFLVAMAVSCTPQPVAGSKAGDHRSRTLEDPEFDGLAVGFVVEGGGARQRTVRGPSDVPRPVEHAWASDGHLAYLLPAYGPVFVVMNHELDAWLDGAEPKLAIRKIDAEGPAKQFSNLRWTDGGQLRFDAACCGSVAEVTVEVPGGIPTVGPWRPIHPPPSKPNISPPSP